MTLLAIAAFFVGALVPSWRRTLLGVAIIWAMFVFWKLALLLTVIATSSVPDPVGGIVQASAYVMTELLIGAVEFLLGGAAGHGVRVLLAMSDRPPPTRDAEQP